MPRTSNIRWRRSDRQAISRTVQQFNAKITRTLKKHPEWAPFLPARLTVEEVTNGIQTRADFNRVINSARRFLRPGAEAPYQGEQGVKTTNWARREAGIRVGIVNRRRNRERRNANVSTEKGTMGSIKANNLLPKKYNINKFTPTAWKKFMDLLERQIRSNYNVEMAIRYKNNYLNAILENLGTEGVAGELYDYIMSLDAEYMYDKYYDDPVLQIQFTSDPLPSELIAEQALEHWKAHVATDQVERLTEEDLDGDTSGTRIN